MTRLKYWISTLLLSVVGVVFLVVCGVPTFLLSGIQELTRMLCGPGDDLAVRMFDKLMGSDFYDED